MALQRYLFTIDLTYPQDRTLRYEAAGEEDLAAAFRRLHPLDAASQPYEVTRLTGLNLLDKRRWAVVDADLIHSKAESLAHPIDWPPVEGSIPAQMQSFLAEGYSAVDRFINYCDIPLAQACLRAARDQIVSARTARPVYEPGAAPDAAMEARWAEGGAQAAVVKGWEWFGAYLRALNIRPWALARLRLALERALVTNSGVTITYRGVTATRPKPPPAVLGPTESSLGPWRVFYLHWLAEGIRPGASIVFGSPQDIAANARDLRQVDDCLRQSADAEWGGHVVGRTYTPCQSSPTGEVLSVWLANSGTVFAPGMNYLDDSGVPIGADDISGPDTGRGYGFIRACGANLRCPQILGMDGPVVYVSTLLEWHLEMLEDLVTYADGKTPFEMVVIARLDATGKNQWTADRFGSLVLDGQNPSAFAAGQAIARGDAERDATDRLIAMTGTAVGLALSATPLGPLGGAIAGLGTAVATFINHAIEHTPPVDYQSDVFGRVEPAMDVFQFSPAGSSSSADRDAARLAMPTPPPGYTPEEAAVRYGWDPPVRVTSVVPGIVAVPPIYRPMVTAENARTVANVAQSASAGSRVAAVAGATLLAGAIGFSVSAARARKRRPAQGQLELAPPARGPMPSPGLPAPHRPRARTAGASR